MESIELQAARALRFLLDEARLFPGDAVAVGCSTSEIAGERIGTAGGLEIAGPLVSALLEELESRGLYLAAQCCEHLNRALVVPRAYANQMRLEEVWAVPRRKAGGAFATAAYAAISDPVLVRSVAAGAGMDIGQTLIGMHLRPVAVPVRFETARVGNAALTLARTRPPLIGGARALYDREDGSAPYK